MFSQKKKVRETSQISKTGNETLVLTTVMSGLDPHTGMKPNLLKQLISLKEMAPGYENPHWLWFYSLFKASQLRFYSTVKVRNKTKVQYLETSRMSS